MRELALNSGLRVLLGVIGGVAVCAGLAVGARQLRSATRDASAWPSAIVIALVCLVIVLGGMRVLQGAWLGRIAVRDPAGRGASRKRG
jgi:protein-S-isoprenylcysteine O-methyltransferase Ste14